MMDTIDVYYEAEQALELAMADADCVPYSTVSFRFPGVCAALYLNHWNNLPNRTDIEVRKTLGGGLLRTGIFYGSGVYYDLE